VRFLVFVTLVGCATAPDHPVQRSLYGDMRQLVETEERLGWLIDRAEIEDLAPAVLQSLCQVEEEQRIGLLDWLDERIEAEGGPAEEAYRRADEDLSAIKELLTLERIRGSLEYAELRASEDCPFYLTPDPEFRGVQADTERLVLVGESFGGLMLLFRDGSIDLGGGGAFRLMVGYGFSHVVTVLIGIEAGGAGAISAKRDEEGEQELSARPAGGVPLVVRFHDDTWIYDLEVAAITQYYRDQLILPPGVRAAGAIGISSVRIADFMPVASGFLAYEFYPEFEDLPRQHGIRIGTKVGINYDP
jgi:hypothetical protein